MKKPITLILVLIILLVTPLAQAENHNQEETAYVPLEPEKEIEEESMGFVMVEPQESQEGGSSLIERRIREYTIGSTHRTGLSSGTMNNIVDPTPFDTVTDIDKAKSFTHVYAWISVGFVGLSPSIYEIRVDIDSQPIANIGSCLSSVMILRSDGSTTDPSRGHGFTELRCTIPLQKQEFDLDLVVLQASGLIGTRTGFTVKNTEIYNHTLPTPSIHPAIESGRFYQDIREYHVHINQTHIDNGASFSVSRTFTRDHLDTVLMENQSDSTLVIRYSLMAIGSVGTVDPTIEFTVTGNQMVAPCIIRSSGEVGGVAQGGSFFCRLTDYAQGFFEVNIAITDPDNVLKQMSMNFAIRQTESVMVPLMPDTMTVTNTEFSFWLPILILGGLFLFALYEGSRSLRLGHSRGPWTLILVLTSFALAAHVIELPWTTELSILLLIITAWVYYLARPGEAGAHKPLPGNDLR
jgi:hypothetical protein